MSRTRRIDSCIVMHWCIFLLNKIPCLHDGCGWALFCKRTKISFDTVKSGNWVCVCWELVTISQNHLGIAQTHTLYDRTYYQSLQELRLHSFRIRASRVSFSEFRVFPIIAKLKDPCNACATQENVPQQVNFWLYPIQSIRRSYKRCRRLTATGWLQRFDLHRPGWGQKGLQPVDKHAKNTQ